ncbi:MAG: hypothetical protein E5W57_19720, partial [Mesorhizobium sp.]
MTVPAASATIPKQFQGSATLSAGIERDNSGGSTALSGPEPIWRVADGHALSRGRADREEEMSVGIRHDDLRRRNRAMVLSAVRR